MHCNARGAIELPKGINCITLGEVQKKSISKRKSEIPTTQIHLREKEKQRGFHGAPRLFSEAVCSHYAGKGVCELASSRVQIYSLQTRQHSGFQLPSHIQGRKGTETFKNNKNLPAMQETLVPEDPLEKRMATHSNILAWEIPWTEEPGGLQFMGSQRVGHD